MTIALICGYTRDAFLPQGRLKDTQLKNHKIKEKRREKMRGKVILPLGASGKEG